MTFQTAILIPALNEKENLNTLIPGIFELMPEVSVLIADDNSTDGTAELVALLQTHFPHLFILRRTKNFGYGLACVEGFKWLLTNGYQVIATMDADYSHDYQVIPDLIKKLSEADVIVGSRYVAGGGVENWNLARKLLSRFANWYVRIILNFPVKDVTAGFNAYRSSVLDKINLTEIKSNGYAFLVELKFRLLQKGAVFSEHPIIFKERRAGKSKMSKKIIWESIWLPWQIRSKRH